MTQLFSSMYKLPTLGWYLLSRQDFLVLVMQPTLSRRSVALYRLCARNFVRWPLLPSWV
jgi:hypothetical protein